MKKIFLFFTFCFGGLHNTHATGPDCYPPYLESIEKVALPDAEVTSSFSSGPDISFNFRPQHMYINIRGLRAPQTRFNFQAYTENLTEEEISEFFRKITQFKKATLHITQETFLEIYDDPWCSENFETKITYLNYSFSFPLNTKTLYFKTRKKVEVK